MHHGTSKRFVFTNFRLPWRATDSEPATMSKYSVGLPQEYDHSPSLSVQPWTHLEGMSARVKPQHGRAGRPSGSRNTATWENTREYKRRQEHARGCKEMQGNARECERTRENRIEHITTQSYAIELNRIQDNTIE